MSNNDLFQQVNQNQSCDDSLLYCLSDLFNVLGYELYQLYTVIYNTVFPSYSWSIHRNIKTVTCLFSHCSLHCPPLFCLSSKSILLLMSFLSSKWFLYPFESRKFCLFPSSIYEYCVLYNHPVHPLFPIYSQIQQYISILFDELYKEIQYLSDLSVYSF